MFSLPGTHPLKIARPTFGDRVDTAAIDVLT